MKLTQLGEFGLIGRIAPLFNRNLPPDVVGIGDDCAVIPTKDGPLLVTTDLLVEEVHFLRHKIPPGDLGYKCLAVNLSDIAAMGGEPTAAFLSIALPKDIEVSWADEFFEGFHALADSTGTALLGGDTTRSATGIIVNVAVIGRAKAGQIKYRSTAQEGDLLCVTGPLGDSGGGLRLLIENADQDCDEDGKALLRAHHRPRPHLAEGRFLASQSAVHAMIDVSDGIDSDLKRIMEASGCGARVFIEWLPISPSLARTASRRKWDAHELAAAAGEDYCLLCTIAPDQFKAVAAAFAVKFEHPLHVIGEITKDARLVYLMSGKEVDLKRHGWDHFKD